MYGMLKKINTSKYFKLPYVIVVITVLVIGGLLYAFYTTRDDKPIPTLNQYTKGEASQPVNSSKTSGQTANSPNSTKTGGSSTSLLAPTGNFISNHRPNLSGSPAPSSMSSVCNTTPGASCKISFTKGDSVKSLPSQVTDAGGATYWFWNLEDIGLTSGNWSISATSSVGDSSKTTTDPRTLVVSQ